MKTVIFNGDGLLSENLLGIHRYEYQILNRLDDLIKNSNIAVQVVVPKNKPCNINFKNIKIVKFGVEKNNSFSKYVWQQIIFPFYTIINRAIGVDMTLALPIIKCQIVSLHDCIIEAFPENYPSKRGKFFRKLYLFKAWCITRGKRKIMTLSEESKKEIIKYYNISEDRINIIPCGWEHMLKVDLDDTILEKYKCLKPGNYFFSLGSKYKHKNFVWVVNAAKTHPQYYFVITGAKNLSDYSKELEQEKLENVIFTGYISDAQIKSLMLGCRALIQPSFYEGFGLPPLEALSLGKQIIVSNASCMPEIYGNAAHYIDPYDYDINLDILIEESVSDGKEILNKYTWSNAAEKFYNLLVEYYGT
ncbi:glycosyltransferase family 4 protein [Clostridium omnivorum]|uniref:Glycosyl transferase family 1 n=1 Tax=Clostridium omnivorum TaxID=1604902 RepID=A0ABQ5N3F1_9CLOT|nr:glycosyltransferase family 1 protein [Clostridium sp. E14]GLC29711.1 glycosyl transferase family 1 [Clostridium sp. E14]